MTRDSIYDENRNEREYYFNANYDEEIKLPLTKDGFEAFLECACAIHNLPNDDLMRQVLAGYIHHIPNEQSTTTFEKISNVLYKSVANSTSWRIDQETKLKIKEENEAKAKELAQSNVTPIDINKEIKA